MQRRALGFAALSTFASLAVFVACGQTEEVAAPVDTTPIVFPLEIPISRNNGAPEPSDAARIEISMSELRLDSRPITGLEGGRLPDAEVADHVVTKLRTALGSGAARPRASLTVNASVPYATLARVMKTLEAAGIREANFRVRRSTSGPDAWWMKLARWRVVPAGDEPVRFESPALQWSAFTDHWREMYESCRASTAFIDCDGTPRNIAPGGDLQLLLWARGQAMKVTFMQVNAPEAQARPQNRGPELIEGVRAPPPPREEDLGPPVTEGAFNFRHQDAVADESALSNTVRPVCGTQSCQAVVEADAATPSMRVISMLGAVFANGFAEPDLAFRLPEMR